MEKQDNIGQKLQNRVKSWEIQDKNAENINLCEKWKYTKYKCILLKND